jgi:hypothetical protein
LLLLPPAFLLGLVLGSFYGVHCWAVCYFAFAFCLCHGAVLICDEMFYDGRGGSMRSL